MPYDFYQTLYEQQMREINMSVRVKRAGQRQWNGCRIHCWRKRKETKNEHRPTSI